MSSAKQVTASKVVASFVMLNDENITLACTALYICGEISFGRKFNLTSLSFQKKNWTYGFKVILLVNYPRTNFALFMGHCYYQRERVFVTNISSKIVPQWVSTRNGRISKMWPIVSFNRVLADFCHSKAVNVNKPGLTNTKFMCRVLIR